MRASAITWKNQSNLPSLKNKGNYANMYFIT